MTQDIYRRALPQVCRKGMALVLAIGAIVVVGALVVSMFFASSLRGKVGQAAYAQARALAAADYGENETLLSILDVSVDSLTIGATSVPVVRAVPGGGSCSATVTRLQQNMFLLVTEGIADSPGNTGLRRRTGFLFRMIRAAADSADTTSTTSSAVRVTQRAWTYLF